MGTHYTGIARKTPSTNQDVVEIAKSLGFTKFDIDDPVVSPTEMVVAKINEANIIEGKPVVVYKLDLATNTILSCKVGQHTVELKRPNLVEATLRALDSLPICSMVMNRGVSCVV